MKMREASAAEIAGRGPMKLFRLFRFHLSTALAMMLVAGALLGVNLLPGDPPEINLACYDATGNTFGWPSTWYDNANIKPRNDVALVM